MNFNRYKIFQIIFFNFRTSFDLSFFHSLFCTAMCDLHRKSMFKLPFTFSNIDDFFASDRDVYVRHCTLQMLCASPPFNRTDANPLNTESTVDRLWTLVNKIAVGGVSFLILPALMTVFDVILNKFAE